MLVQKEKERGLWPLVTNLTYRCLRQSLTYLLAHPSYTFFIFEEIKPDLLPPSPPRQDLK